MQAYQENLEFKKWARLFLALPHVPINLVSDLFTDVIMAQAPFNEIPTSTEFCDYFTNTWLENANFPLNLWNCYAEIDRTINAAEGWHNRLNDCVSRAHPNIFDAILILKKEQERIDLALVQLINGAALMDNKAKYKRRQERINNMRSRLENNLISSHQYLFGISSLFSF